MQKGGDYMPAIQYMKNPYRCPVCENLYEREDMLYTRDCHGITFRLVCHECYESVMAEGYDGEYYTEADECLDEYW